MDRENKTQHKEQRLRDLLEMTKHTSASTMGGQEGKGRKHG